MLLASCAKTPHNLQNPQNAIVNIASTPALAHALKVKENSQKSSLPYQIVKSLTVEVGPRIAGSQGDKRAVAWAEAKFNELGFDKVYKQAVRVRNWERGFADAKVVSPFPQTLVISALGGSIATPEKGLEAKVVMFDSLDSLAGAEKAKVEGNIVFLNTRMERDRAGSFYGQVVPNRVSGAVEAAKQGAKAVIIRSVGTDNSRFAHTGALDDGAGVGIVMAAAKLVKEAVGQPKRTIRVVLYAAEEIGLVGAYQYVRTNQDTLENIIFAAESDFGAGQIYQLDTRFAEAVRNDPADLYSALKMMGVELGNNTTNGGPDVSMLPNYGVPVIALKQDGTYYFDYHHTPNDTLDKIKPEDIQQNQTVWAMITAYMAMSDFDPRPAANTK
jgi:hypothetical protein